MAKVSIAAAVQMTGAGAVFSWRHLPHVSPDMVPPVPGLNGHLRSTSGSTIAPVSSFTAGLIEPQTSRWKPPPSSTTAATKSQRRQIWY